MCGIVGYIGRRSAVPLILDSLHQLEYRGYDSAGVAFLQEDESMAVYKASGKLGNLEALLPETLRHSPPPNGRRHSGIGHIRWATHGAANDVNAHPHINPQQHIALVHNGIIENYFELKTELIAQGYTFISDTDTECVVHLLAMLSQQCESFTDAIRQTVQRLKGSYALVILNQKTPDRLYAVRHQAPLVVGQDAEGGGYMVASDTVALATITNRVLYLKDHDVVTLSLQDALLTNAAGDTQPVAFETIQTHSLLVDKKGYKHFMLKEIYEQPDVLRNSLSGRLVGIHEPVAFYADDMQNDIFRRRLMGIDRLVVVGCGTSYNAGLVGKYLLEQLVRLPVEVISAGECRYAEPVWNERTLVLAISQSGETADTLAALRLASACASRPMILTLTNREDSSMARESDWVLSVRAGVEVSVCATKSFSAQVLVLTLLSVAMAEQRQTADPALLQALKEGLFRLPSQLEAMLSDLSVYHQLARQYGHARDMIFIARGINYPVAMEGALKLKEVSYIHAEGYSGSELKHGPIALLDAQVPVVAVLASGVVFEKMISNCQEAKARDSQIIGFSCEPVPEGAQSIFDNLLELPVVHELLSPLITALPLQALAYYTAEYLGKDVDQPRNLAKSVTVE